MNVLFVHQNFPGQFKHLAPALVARGHRVWAMTMRRPETPTWQGVELVPYAVERGSTPGIHPWLKDLETKTLRGEACFKAALALRQRGVMPDVVIAHPGWGESLFLKEVWPHARLGIYAEFFYAAQGADVGFDPEFPVNDAATEACRLRLKNANQVLHFDTAQAGLSPTHWQASTFPLPFRQRIEVIHDGIDTGLLVPRTDVSLSLNGQRLDRNDEIITFVNRQLEPYRGYHTFMRALPEILRQRPRARVILVGGDGVSYGAPPAPALYGQRSWKQVFIDEVRPRIPAPDWARVHFVGQLSYPQFVALLQLSRVHVYLTYPFVLSWSLLEAMSIGCAIVASDTAPVREAIVSGQTGALVDFFDAPGLAQRVCALLDDRAECARLGSQARDFARAHYDLQRHCLPRQLVWTENLADHPL